MSIVGRNSELELLEKWWKRPDEGMAIIWGRRRIGKTALAEAFSEGKRVLFHTGTNSAANAELRVISRLAKPLVDSQTRDLIDRPFTDWIDCLDALAMTAKNERVLLVLDEFPELEKSSPELSSILRAFWDRVAKKTKLRILLAGSAVTWMEELQTERSALHGRFTLKLQLHPLAPMHVAAMLPKLAPAACAQVWGLVGGVPLYLKWWEQAQPIEENLRELFCGPGAKLLHEGEYILATEASNSDLARQCLFAIANGRTRYSEIKDAIMTSPARVLEDLIALRLVKRVVPVTEITGRSKLSYYAIADNFLAFWLGPLSKYRSEIARGLGESILPVLLDEIDDFMGARWEDAYRQHLRHLANLQQLRHQRIVAIGSFWRRGPDPAELDAIALAGRSREVVCIGEAKWTREVDASRILPTLTKKAYSLPAVSPTVQYSICARGSVINAPDDCLVITAKDIFSPKSS